MSKKLIGFGKCSPFYLFILGDGLFKCLRDCLFNFGSIDPQSDVGLFLFKPILSDHPILTSIFAYIGYIIFGLALYFIREKKSLGERKNSNISKSKSKKKGLIYRKLSIKKKIVLQIIAVGLIFSLHSDLIKGLYLFDISGFDIWTFDIIFISFFMGRYFVETKYKHHNYSILFIIFGSTTLIFLSTFLPKDNNEIKDKNDYNIIRIKFGQNIIFSLLIIIIIFIIFTFISYITAFGRVLSKFLMEVKFISPYRIIISTGIAGFLLNSIFLIFSTKIKCPNNKIFNGSCLVLYNNSENIEKYYYDNLFAYFSHLNKQNNKEFNIEIFVLIPLYLVISFLEFSCEIFTIYYLTPKYLLIRDNLYYGLSRIILIIYNSNNITLPRFFLLEFAEIIAIMGYLVYLEIIELHFCGFDEKVMRNLTLKAKNEIDNFSLIEDEEDNNYDKNKETYDKDFTSIEMNSHSFFE